MAKSFKTDESFQNKIAIGAIGTKKVFEDLQKQGHEPIALDRGSMSFKIWKAIKIKRLRVPDILCVKSGIKVESRTKTNLEISMSHSQSDPDRGWDFGLDDNDYVALPICYSIGESPLDWCAYDIVQYIKLSDLKEAKQKGRIFQEKPKGAEEGFEIRLIWPCSIASADGIIKNITDERIQWYRKEDNRTISLSLVKKNGITVKPLFNIGDKIKKNQIVASIVPVIQSIPLSDELPDDYYLNLLDSHCLADRYAASKALFLFKTPNSLDKLKRVIKNTSEHIYVKLEAAATLMRLNIPEGYNFIKRTIESDEYLENRLEGVIVISEVNTKASTQILTECLLDTNQDNEIRAGAAWGLGEINDSESIQALVHSFKGVSTQIKIEAARALAKISKDYRDCIITEFPKIELEARPGLAWAIAKAGGFSLDDILPIGIDEDSRQWLAYILGSQNPDKYSEEIIKLKNSDPQVYFATNVLWKIFSSWIYGLLEY